MTLPTLKYPTESIRQPSTGKTLRFRPFIVGEEKVLLMAKQEGDPRATMRCIRQLLEACTLEEPKPQFTALDLEYMFLKLRAMSVNNVVRVSYRDLAETGGDDKVYDFIVDLNNIELETSTDRGVERPPNRVPIGEGQGIMLRDPPASLYEDPNVGSNQTTLAFDVSVHCIESIWDGDKVLEAKRYSLKELREFVERLEVKTFEAMRDYIDSAPRLKYTLNYTNSKGSSRSIVLSTISDFFSLVSRTQT